MKTIPLPFGNQTLPCTLPEEKLRGVLVSSLHSYRSELSERELVEQALRQPIGSRPLAELARGCKRWCSSQVTTPALCQASC